MNEKIFKQILSDIEGICAAQGNDLENEIISLVLTNSQSISAFYGHIEACNGYARIWSDTSESYEFIPYENILRISC